MDAAELERTVWDAVIVGTGMGGATIGHALARAGRRVLFVEKGRSSLPGHDAIRNTWAEEYQEGWREGARQDEIFARSGRCTDEIDDRTPGMVQQFRPLIGMGTGGSTALYGSVLERFFPEDFHPRQQFSDVDGTTLPDHWPIDYDDLQSWYAEAERLYRVRGGVDPLRPHEDGAALLPPAELTPGNRELFDFLGSKALHPYHLRVGFENKPGCDSCIGYLCGQSCKSDSTRICLAPAVQDHEATLLTECRALRLEADRVQVRRLICDWRGTVLALQGHIFVLAAGTLFTPVLLLNSTSADWPRGLSNRSGQVGRNLMRHCVEFVAVKTECATPVIGQTKEIGLNDFYAQNGQRLGTVQSFGPLPPFEYLIGQRGWGPKLARWASPALRPLWNKLRGRRLPFASVMEDLPYAENCVLPSQGNGAGGRTVQIRYQLREEAVRRLKTFRTVVGEAFRPYPQLWGKVGTRQPEPDPRVRHLSVR